MLFHDLVVALDLRFGEFSGAGPTFAQRCSPTNPEATASAALPADAHADGEQLLRRFSHC